MKTYPGEVFNTLDGVERVLITDNLVVLIVIGLLPWQELWGENSEIKDETKDVFLESAYFEPINNRRTNRYFAMRTDASNRFEKGIDPFGQVLR